MTTTYEGIAGAMTLMRAIEDPEQYDTGHIPQLRHVLVELAQRVISLGNLANEMEVERMKVQEFYDEGNMGVASATALNYISCNRDALREIAKAMHGKVRVDLGNLDDSPTLREVNERRGYRESEPDGPVADSVDGYTIKPGEE